MKGQIIGGRFGEIWIREKQGEELELGELLIAKTPNGKMLLQVYDLLYGSQVSRQNLELASGMQLEDNTDFEFVDESFHNYTLAVAKNVLSIEKSEKSAKKLPKFFSLVREVDRDDFSFLTKPNNPLSFGFLRSGSKRLEVPIFLDGEKVLSHHLLISGTTGKGKSVLMKNLLWDAVDKDYCSLLVLDPHDEYFGRNELGLKDHSKKEKVVYYGYKNVPTGQKSLKINLYTLRPEHFDFLSLTEPQRQLIYSYFKIFRNKWIEKLFVSDLETKEFQESSVAVVRRLFRLILNVDSDGKEVYCSGVFDKVAGQSTVTDIVNELEKGKTVIIDTSNFSGNLELLVGSMISQEVFNKYRYYRMKGVNDKPVIGIVLEEAPRVLGKEVLANNKNIFETLAREGRKFRVGVIAITQLPSLIPRDILANMNTKIILGSDMKNERDAIIESSSQDLSNDSRSIASLDKGEAILSSNFSRFAVPLSIPFFDDQVKREKHKKPEVSFEGVNLENGA